MPDKNPHSDDNKAIEQIHEYLSVLMWQITTNILIFNLAIQNPEILNPIKK